MKPVIVIVDMLNDFILKVASLECAKGREIIKPIKSPI